MKRSVFAAITVASITLASCGTTAFPKFGQDRAGVINPNDPVRRALAYRVLTCGLNGSLEGSLRGIGSGISAGTQIDCDPVVIPLSDIGLLFGPLADPAPVPVTRPSF